MFHFVEKYIYIQYTIKKITLQKALERKRDEAMRERFSFTGHSSIQYFHSLTVRRHPLSSPITCSPCPGPTNLVNNKETGYELSMQFYILILETMLYLKVHKHEIF